MTTRKKKENTLGRWHTVGQAIRDALLVCVPAWDEGAIQGDVRTPVTPCSHRPFTKLVASHYAITLAKDRNCMTMSLKPGIMTPGWVLLGLRDPWVRSRHLRGVTGC
jgi:hypothetical protein